MIAVYTPVLQLIQKRTYTKKFYNVSKNAVFGLFRLFRQEIGFNVLCHKLSFLDKFALFLRLVLVCENFAVFFITVKILILNF